MGIVGWLVTAVAWSASARVSDLGKPVVAGIRLDSCDAALAAKGDGRYRGVRLLEVKGGHFSELGFVGDSSGCFAVGGAVNEAGEAELPALGELIARDGNELWYTTAMPGIYRVEELLTGKRVQRLWWVGDWDRWVAERHPMGLADYRGYIAASVAAADLPMAAGFAETATFRGADAWNALVAAPLMDVVQPRIAELEARLAAGEAPEVVGRELDALIPLVPDAMRSDLWPLRYQLHDALLLRSVAARAAGARATDVGLRYLAFVLYPDSDRASHEALREAALALVPELSPLPSGASFGTPQPSEGMEAVAAAVLGDGGTIIASFPGELPASGSRLVVDTPLALELQATTTTGERAERVRTSAYDDLRAAAAQRAERTREILAEKWNRAAGCGSTSTVYTPSSSVTRTERFSESDKGTGLTLSGVRDVTTTTEARTVTTTSYDAGCGQGVEAWARTELAALGPPLPAWVRRDTIRTVVLVGQWQTWTGRATRTVRLVAPGGTEVTIAQSEPVSLGPYLRASGQGVEVDEWRTEAQVRAEVEARLDEALVERLRAELDARIVRDAAKLPPEWREQEVGWARWIYGDGPAMASIAPTKFRSYRGRVSDAAWDAWDDAMEHYHVHTLVPIGEHRWAATVWEDHMVVLDGRYNRVGLPLGMLAVDSGPILPVPGREAVIVTDAGMPSLIDVSGPEAAWHRVGPGCQEEASLRGLGPDARVLVRGKDWTGWCDPVTGALEKLPASVGDAWPWFEPGRLLTFGDDGVDVLDVATGERTRLVTTATRGELSMRQDGRLIAIVNDEGWEVWDALNGTRTASGTFSPSPYAYHGHHGAFHGDELWLTAGAAPTRELGYGPIQLLRDPTLRPAPAE
ncbi:MAG: hypothetical protein H6738_21330 [Alphaproteobacteria bacterium]|nr:hypothetical protein [Alphaproteobacteria bacterium]